ncbi:dihydrodipicolinate synthase family protein [Nocardia salmonicida]|uniref:dihydrodipicolinate synthase family protein n=1 Tax=Nocardia salmonicida TaxID=53431 RepID=UPI0033E3FDBB
MTETSQDRTGSLTMIEGIIAYPVTPFADDETTTVDTGKLAELVNRLVLGGAHAIAPSGSTGESAYLTEPEFDAVVETTIDVVAGRVPVIVGASELTTAATISRARRAERAGADAVMILPVSYWKLSEREIIEHYRSIGDAIELPIMVYNNPATSGIDMSPRLLVSMFETIPAVQMVKESTGDLARMSAIRDYSGGQLPYYNGSNPLVLDALSHGASGWCTAAHCLAPQLCLELYHAVRDGEIDRAAATYATLRPLLEFIVAGGLPATVKAGLDLLGLGVGAPRRPLLPPTQDDISALKSILAGL